jgi:hypothetical protein
MNMKDTRISRLEELIRNIERHLVKSGCLAPFPYLTDEAEFCRDTLTEICRRWDLDAEFSVEKGRPVIRFYPR